MGPTPSSTSMPPATASADPTAAGAQPVTMNGASSATPLTAPVCYLTDKLSSEVRIRIYEYIFSGARARRIEPARRATLGEHRQKSSLVPRSDSSRHRLFPSHSCRYLLQAGEKRVSTNIFAVSKLIHNESIESFYNTTIISATWEEFHLLLTLGYPRSLIRNIEIVSCNSQPGFGGYVHYLLSEARNIAATQDIYYLERWLHGQFDGIRFTHQKILRMWPEVINTPEGYDALREVGILLQESMVGGMFSNLAAWGAHTSFRLWVGLLQQLSDHWCRGYFPPYQSIFSFVSFSQTWVGKRMTLPKGFQMHKLGPSNHPRLLEDFTEMLSVHTQSYKLHFRGEDEREVYSEIRRPQWEELGDESELKYEAYHQGKQHKEVVALMMRDPIHEKILIPWYTMQDALLSVATVEVVHGKQKIDSASKEDMHAMFSLHYAMGLANSSDDFIGDEKIAHEEWSEKLLRRYFHVARIARADLLDRVPLRVLRVALNFTFAVSAIVDSPPLNAPEGPREQEAYDRTGDDMQGRGDGLDGAFLEALEEYGDGNSAVKKLSIEEGLLLAREPDNVDYDADDIVPDELDARLYMPFVRGSGRHIRAAWDMLYPEIVKS
ncbi:uncharacterized protein RCC_00929 [Ramularia collo-cygni]|uniref:Uncharacterized protein n=1 Tax=Ramularia collo-cygni TaxID=112498 RepID=A0A2D3UVI5_9PEZI|nr:uncharacterized protein RCC_00929 [Ramularia collo-cygni]CZT15016.1 uncharacterized protein RCC_00929 [Ramularia collo-cygni]